MANELLTLALQPREAGNSRDARRLRRSGVIPGVLYGLDQDPQPVGIVPAELRQILVSGSALFDVDIDGSKQPVLIKRADRHPVRGDVTHVDFLRVDLSQKIESIVPLELTGVEEAPGVIGRGVLDHQLREITVLALPTDIPDSITVDVSAMDIGDSLLLSTVQTPDGVDIVSEHADEIAVVTIAASRTSRSTDDSDEGDDAAEGEAEGGESEASGDE